MSHIPQRIVSLQPSITSTIDRLGLLDRVVACTKYCIDVCPSLAQPGSQQIIVADSWTAQSSQILDAAPDLVIASVPYQLDAVAEILKAGIAFLGLAPHSLADIYRDISMIAGVLGAAQEGRRLIEEMESEVDYVQKRAKPALAAGAVRPRVYCEEWGKPLIHSQGWVAELVTIVGGDFIGVPGAHADAASILAEDPDVIIAAWCGAGDRVPLEKIITARGWSNCKAAIDQKVFCINDEFLNTPGPTLVRGLHALAAAIHPEIFPGAKGLRRISQETSMGMFS